MTSTSYAALCDDLGSYIYLSEKNTDPACERVHKGESSACLNSIGEPLLRLLKEDNALIKKVEGARTFRTRATLKKAHSHRMYRQNVLDTLIHDEKSICIVFKYVVLI